jgi:hypothetical protein
MSAATEYKANKNWFSFLATSFSLTICAVPAHSYGLLCYTYVFFLGLWLVNFQQRWQYSKYWQLINLPLQVLAVYRPLGKLREEGVRLFGTPCRGGVCFDDTRSQSTQMSLVTNNEVKIGSTRLVLLNCNSIHIFFRSSDTSRPASPLNQKLNVCRLPLFKLWIYPNTIYGEHLVSQ